VQALRARPRTGRPGTKGEAALACASGILCEPGETLWTLPRLKAEIKRRCGVSISMSRLSILLRKKSFAWRRPRHTLNGRQDKQAIERSGVRLSLLRQQAQAGDIRLFFQDESEALTHPYLAHVWAKRGADLRIEAPGQSRKRGLFGLLDAASKELTVLTSATKRSTDFVCLLEELDRRYAPGLGVPAVPIVIVLDNGPIHTSKLTTKALADRPWLTVEWLPKYAPELNDIERSWRDLKRHHLANRTFQSVEDLDAQIHLAVQNMNQERIRKPCNNFRKAA
jgi:transposase